MGLAALGVAALLGTACTNATLYDPVEIPRQPNKIAFTGRVCTDNPAERSFPLRVVFVVDSSPILPIDPLAPPSETATLLGQRVNAVRDVVNVLRSPDTEFALIRYGGDSFVTPEGGYTDNTQEIVDAAGALTVPLPCTADGCRRLPQALSLAASLISGDLLSTARGPRSRTKYVVVVVQAGPTDDRVIVPTDGCDLTCLLGQRVADLRSFVLDNGGADLQLHTVDLSPLSPDPLIFGPTGLELQRMAFSGAGEYRPVCQRADDGTVLAGTCAPQAFSLLTLSIQSARNVFLKKSFLVSNLNAVTTPDGAIPDSDADGLADVDEPRYGTDPLRRDTDGDGIGDKTELLLSTVGVNPLVFDDPAPCEPVDPALRTTLDTDGDGLSDCEEILLRLDPTLFDTDADGSPDTLEVMMGTNFLEDDGLADGDFDGTPNNVELRTHTNPRAADARARNELAYLYRENDLGIRVLLFATQPREITGVVVEDVSADSTLGNGGLSYVLTATGDRVIAWRDAGEAAPGPGVRIENDGELTLHASCAGVENCQRSITVSISRAILPPFPVDELLRVAAAERQCTDFRVRNVTLVQTQQTETHAAGFNDIRIFFGQVPAEVPGAFGIFRVAQFPFTFIAPDFKDPDVSDQLVDDFRFVLFE